MAVKTGTNLYINSYPERIKLVEIDVRKSKLVSYASMVGGSVGSVWSYMASSEWGIGLIFLTFGILFRIFPTIFMEKTLYHLRKQAEVHSVIES